MDPCISHDYQFIILSLLVSWIHQLLDSDIRTLAGDRWREMVTKEVGGGGGCHFAVLSRLADLHHLSAPLISIHFSPGTFIRAYHRKWKKQKKKKKNSSSLCSDQLRQWPRFSLGQNSRSSFAAEKVIRFPYFSRSKKIRSRLIHSVRRTKTTFCVGYWMFLNCPVKHNSVRLMASFTQ